MKRILGFILLVMCILSLTACGAPDVGQEQMKEDVQRSILMSIWDPVGDVEIISHSIDKDMDINVIHIKVEASSELTRIVRYYELHYEPGEKGKWQYMGYNEEREDEWKEYPVQSADESLFDAAIAANGIPVDDNIIPIESLELKEMTITDRDTKLDECTDTALVKLEFLDESLDLSGSLRVQLAFSDGKWKTGSVEVEDAFKVPEEFIDSIPKPTDEEILEMLEGNQFSLEAPPPSDDPYDVQSAQVIHIRKELISNCTISDKPVLSKHGNMCYYGEFTVDYGFASYIVDYSVLCSRHSDGKWRFSASVSYTEGNRAWNLRGVYSGYYSNLNAWLVITEQGEDNAVKGTLLLRGGDNNTIFNVFYMDGGIVSGDRIQMHATDSFLHSATFSNELSINGIFDFNKGSITQAPEVYEKLNLRKTDAVLDDLRFIHDMNIRSNRQWYDLEPDKYYDFIQSMRDTYQLDVMVMPELSVFGSEDSPEEALVKLYQALDLGFDDQKSGIIILYTYNASYFICIGGCEERIPENMRSEIHERAQQAAASFSSTELSNDAFMDSVMNDVQSYLAEGKLY